MNRIFKKIKERLEEYFDKSGLDSGKKEIMRNIINQVAEEYKNKFVSIEAYKQVAWERDIAIEQLHELGYEFGQKIDKEEFCEWIKYDYRTIAPKNHDVENPYWRIPEDMGKLKFCPYCGKEIKVVE